MENEYIKVVREVILQPLVRNEKDAIKPSTVFEDEVSFKSEGDEKQVVLEWRGCAIRVTVPFGKDRKITHFYSLQNYNVTYIE